MNGKNKVKQISEDGLHFIPSLSSSEKTQIMGGKDCLRCKGKTLRVFVVPPERLLNSLPRQAPLEFLKQSHEQSTLKQTPLSLGLNIHVFYKL